MKESEKDYVRMCVNNEGFGYCFMHYSHFSDIEDEKFHELRKAYIKAQKELSEYCEIEN